jgi:phenylacetic acid degradation operon negative regulatory protein
MTIESASKSLVAEFRSRRTLRTGSLITTVFGDSIAPRGGTVWLGSLIAVMRDFGINERLVRTSVFRLVQDGWLQSNQVGRRSYYSLTEEGRERFEQATHKIYGEPATSWDTGTRYGRPRPGVAAPRRRRGARRHVRTDRAQRGLDAAPGRE